MFIVQSLIVASLPYVQNACGDRKRIPVSEPACASAGGEWRAWRRRRTFDLAERPAPHGHRPHHDGVVEAAADEQRRVGRPAQTADL